MSNTYSIINNPLLQDATVASQAVGNIQQTLATLGSYTPTEVNTFLDWSYDAGDVVTLVKDGANYSMPIFTNYLNWNGAHDVTWGNSGNEERELPNVQERRSYGYGSTIAAVDQKVDTKASETEFRTYVDQTDEYISLIATETEVATARTLNKSLFTITAERITSEVTAQSGVNTTLQSQIDQSADAIALVVTSTESGGTVTHTVNSAAIFLAINGEGGSNAYIEADNIILNGSSIVATGEVESQALATAEIQCTYLYQMGASGELGVDGEAHFYGPVYMEGTQNFFGDDGVGTLAGPTVSVNTLNLNAGEGGASYNLTTSNVSGMITDLQLTGPTNNVYTLQKKTVANTSWTDVGTFSRATSLSGVWSGRNYTVTATPQGDTKTGIVYDGLVPTGSVRKSGQTVYKSFIVYSDDGEGDADEVIMTKEVGIDASDVYQDGQNSVSVVKGAWSGGVLIASPSAGTGSSATIQLAQGSGSWNASGTTYSRPILDGQGNTGYTATMPGPTVSGVTITPSTQYYADVDVSLSNGYTQTKSSIYIGDLVEDAYQNGWDRALDFVYLDPDTDETISSARTVKLMGFHDVESSTPFEIARVKLTPSGGGGSHNPTVNVTTGSGSVAGYTYLKTYTASSLSHSYMFLDVTCGSTTNKYYIVMN